MNRARRLLEVIWRPAVAILGAALVSSAILLVAGYDAPAALSALVSASFDFGEADGFIRSLANMLNKASPLMFTGIAVAIAFRCNVFNIGTEGQFLFGAIGSVCVGHYLPLAFPGIPGFVLRPLMLLAGMILGALWALIPGYLKVMHGVSEIITTIMLNYVAQQFVGYMVRGPIMDKSQAEAQSVVIAQQGYMPYLIGPEQVRGTRLHAGFLIGCVLAVILYVILFRTYLGYEIRATGLNPKAAKCGGISVKKTMICTMLLSGALAGLGGAIELAGNTHYLLENISPGYGFTAIAISILAANNPIGVIFSSSLFGFLNNGAAAMQRAAGVTKSFVDVFQGVIIVFVGLAAVSQAHRKVRRKPKTKGEARQ